MRSITFLMLSFTAFALAKPYNPYATSNEDTAKPENFFRHRHHHRRTRPLPTTEQSITTAAEVKEVTGNSEVVTLVAGNAASDDNGLIVVTSPPDAKAHRTPRNRITRGILEQSSDIPVFIHGAAVTDNSEAHVTQNPHRHHQCRRTAHPLPTGKASTSADAEEVSNADNVTPAAEIVVTHDAAILLTGEPDSKVHRTLGGRFTRKLSTSKPDARAHRTRAAVTGLAPVITSESAAYATDDSAWLKEHVTIAA